MWPQNGVRQAGTTSFVQNQNMARLSHPYGLDHISNCWRLAVRLAETKCKWLLSSYDVPEVRQMYVGYDVIPIQSYSGMNTKKNGSERVLNQEVVIANFNTQTADLLYPQGGQLALQRPLLKLEEPVLEFEIASGT
jgi:hypothetical protein